jgi:xylulose-5-phosphate/fructose-6-phosphate phosphoketolase
MGEPAFENIENINKYWRALNYLSVGMIYLKDNPLLTEPLKPEHIKPRLLGHRGSNSWLEFHIYSLEPSHC